MKVTHVLSGETLFAYQNALDNSFVDPKTSLTPNALYHCRRFLSGSGYSTVDVYGSELTPV